LFDVGAVRLGSFHWPMSTSPSDHGRTCPTARRLFDQLDEGACSRRRHRAPQIFIATTVGVVATAFGIADCSAPRPVFAMISYHPVRQPIHRAVIRGSARAGMLLGTFVSGPCMNHCATADWVVVAGDRALFDGLASRGDASQLAGRLLVDLGDGRGVVLAGRRDRAADGAEWFIWSAGTSESTEDWMRAGEARMGGMCCWAPGRLRPSRCLIAGSPGHRLDCEAPGYGDGPVFGAGAVLHRVSHQRGPPFAALGPCQSAVLAQNVGYRLVVILI